MDLIEELNYFAQPVRGWKYDRFNPTTYVALNDENVERLNRILDELKRCHFNQMIHTPSGGISYAVENRGVQSFSFDLVCQPSGWKLTVIILDAQWSFQVGGVRGPTGRLISPSECWMQFAGTAKRCKVDLSKYKVTREEGLEIKKNIPRPKIGATITQTADEPFIQHVHYLDFHFAHPGFAAKQYPALWPLVNKLAEYRKTNEYWKPVGDVSIGWCQRKKNPIYAPIAFAAVSGLRNAMDELTKKLEAAGYTPLLFRTDGIWYCKMENGHSVPSEPYHDKQFITTEGPMPGQWQNQYVDAQLRIKSAGSYEFIESNGTYHPRVCGQTRLDSEKPRNQWQPGDIYRTSVYTYLVKYDGIYPKIVHVNEEEYALANYLKGDEES